MSATSLGPVIGEKRDGNRDAKGNEAENTEVFHNGDVGIGVDWFLKQGNKSIREVRLFERGPSNQIS